MLKKKNFIVILFQIFFSSEIIANERWVLDKDLSTINLELPVLFANNVKGEFKEIEGLIEIDLNTKKNNKAIFSVKLNSIQINYTKYKELLLSDIFFNSYEYPIALVDTKKFSYKNESEITLNVELTIKGLSQLVPLKLKIIHLTDELVQIKGKLFFSRTNFNIGIGKWSMTSILKDKALIQTNLFLFKE